MNMKIIYEAPKAVEVMMAFDASILTGSLTLGESSGENVTIQDSEVNPW